MNSKIEIIEKIHEKMDELDDFDHPDGQIRWRRRRAYERLQQASNRLCGYEDDQLDDYIESQRSAKRALYRGDQLYDLIGRPYRIGDDGLHVFGLNLTGG